MHHGRGRHAPRSAEALHHFAGQRAPWGRFRCTIRGGVFTFVEEFVRYILVNLDNDTSLDLSNDAKTRIAYLQESFNPIRMDYMTFLDKLRQRETITDPTQLHDLNNVELQILRHVSSPTFVFNHPSASWAAKRTDLQHVNGFNFILPNAYGEVCEACERENDVDVLRYKFRCAGITN